MRRGNGGTYGSYGNVVSVGCRFVLRLFLEGGQHDHPLREAHGVGVATPRADIELIRRRLKLAVDISETKG